MKQQQGVAVADSTCDSDPARAVTTTHVQQTTGRATEAQK